MPNDRPDQSRKKLYEEYEDSLFRLVMHDVAEKEGKLFLEEKEQLKNDPEYVPAKAALENFNKQLEAYFKKSKDYAGKQRMLKTLNRVAVVVLIVLAVLFTSVITVQAVRVRVLNFWMDIKPEYTSFQLKESGGDSDGSDIAINWHKAYAPTYIPAGYEVSDIFDGELIRKIEFKNAQGLLITYMELSESSKPALDTENASVFETININGHEGTLVVKNSLATIIWAMNDRIFIMQGQIEKDIVIKMAEGVKYIN